MSFLTASVKPKIFLRPGDSVSIDVDCTRLPSSQTRFELIGPADPSEGSSCVSWLVRSQHGQLAVFKPQDGEGYNNNNKEGGMPLKRGVVYGDSTRKEVAAYLLDHDHFAGVPLTQNAELLLEGTSASSSTVMPGSLQQFVTNIGAAEEFGSSCFPVDEVHRIGMLDIRLLNLDRHLGNLLVCEEKADKSLHLVPIDHGFCLPSYRALHDVRLEWSHWKQCHEPFSLRQHSPTSPRSTR
jgi:hypothetical protein